MKKPYLPLVLILAALLCLCACGASGAETAAEAPATTAPEPTPEPTPEPFVEPVTEPGGEAYFDGNALPGGWVSAGGNACVRLSEAAEALGSTLEREADGGFSFAWRKSRVTVYADSLTARYLDSDRALSAAPLLCQGGEDLLVPMESLCDAAEIGFFNDEEFATLYGSPETGNWAIPENYAVPVMMYHKIGHAPDTANLIVAPESLEAQFKWFTENGFTGIWFEDLWHVEDFVKPIILVFDDGYEDMYRYVYPMAEKYGIKVEIAVVKDITQQHSGARYISEDNIIEMDQSDTVSFQSHGVTHENLAESWNVPDPEAELRESSLWLTRLLKKAPCTIVYPIGGSTPEIQETASHYYRFGVKMVGKVYVTGEDPMEIYRYFVERQTPLEGYAEWCIRAFDDPSLNNYFPRSGS